MAQDPLAQNQTVRRGMDDLVVDTTAVSWVDGQRGRLYYRGYRIEELAKKATFEEIAYLLLCGELPSEQQLLAFTWKLRQLSHTPEKIIRILQELPRQTAPLSALQTALAALGCTDPTQKTSEEENLLGLAMRIIVQTPIILASFYRLNQGACILSARDDLSHAENFLYMLSGRVPDPKDAHAMEIALILQMDHGFNSSTFTARAVASTLTNIYAATSAAVGALSGPLHGGASELVVEMLDEIEDWGDVDAYLDHLFAQGGKVMGMGHRVYKQTDPRAVVFEDLLEEMTQGERDPKDLKILSRVAQRARAHFESRQQPIHVNVDFWSGAVYRRLGIQPILFPAIFAAARIVGWCAHILELRQNNRLYRPLSLYTGPVDLKFASLKDRNP
ncbi:MAG: citrate/2-methylcitrate synthase [Betaproteobacteria bacterium]|nr:citrate/2-methylcitrate synthase [Betaproteobacteria bacterium]